MLFVIQIILISEWKHVRKPHHCYNRVTPPLYYFFCGIVGKLSCCPAGVLLLIFLFLPTLNLLINEVFIISLYRLI